MSASKKKHRKEPKHKVRDIKQFAKEFVANIGDRNKAALMVKNYENISRMYSMRSDVFKDDQKHYLNLANFWNNMLGVINKL